MGNVVVLETYKVYGESRKVVVCSAYLSFGSADLLLSKDMVEVLNYCMQKRLGLVLGCDANSHHVMWESTDMNSRTRVLEYWGLQI
jgi:hypothetical protein